jgi:phosphoglycolate phosphatase-like HAD superfamily hydrolase
MFHYPLFSFIISIMLENLKLPNTELDYTYRVEELKNCLDKQQIYLVALDVDNTVVDTSPYYKNFVRKINLELASQINPTKTPDTVADEVSEQIWKTYRDNGYKPQLIANRYLDALSVYTQKDVPISMIERINSHFSDFYLKSPAVFESTPVLINSLLAAGRPIIFHSHAQDDWTEIKVNKIVKKCGLDKIGFEIPFLGTPLEEDKDAKSWLKAYSRANEHYGIEVEPANVLSIGDNWYADILSSYQAGSKNFLWINYAQRSPEVEDTTWVSNVNVVETKSIGTAIDDYILKSYSVF